jgi:hypothetical protein
MLYIGFVPGFGRGDARLRSVFALPGAWSFGRRAFYTHGPELLLQILIALQEADHVDLAVADLADDPAQECQHRHEQRLEETELQDDKPEGERECRANILGAHSAG